MHETLTTILELQEPDMKMLQLMHVKRDYQKQLLKLSNEEHALTQKVETKQNDILELKKAIRLAEGDLAEITAKYKKLEAQQHSIKKVEEFNALNHEMSQVERERVSKDQRLNEAYEKVALEEEGLQLLQKSLENAIETSKALKAEIAEHIKSINKEGRELKAMRDKLVLLADPEILHIYERLLQNKQDRVVVPIEDRCCSGCHIMLTAQDENMVRKGEHIVYCEHCSRILFWQESEGLEGTTVATKQRRRRKAAA